MPRFNYTAMDGHGKEKKGTIDADNEQQAAQKLKQQDLYPTNIAPDRKQKSQRTAPSGGAKKRGGGLGSITIGTPKIKTKILATFTRQLATLIDAGLPLVRALRTLEKQARKDPILGRIVGDLADSVEGGSNFSEALAGHPKSFSKLYVSMVRAGEASGALENVLTRLAEFLEKGQRVAGKVKSALTYPIVVLVIALLITGGLMVTIVPKFAKIFADMLGEDHELPGLTQFILGISDFMRNNWIATIAIVVTVFVALKLLRRTRAGSYGIDVLKVRMPPFNSLIVRSVVTRFCRTLGTLMQSGVAVLQALQIVRDTADNEVISRAIQTVHDAVKEGESMSRPLESTNVFPGMVVSMIEVGEETGALPEMLNRVADVYEEEVDRAVEALTSLIEPMMIVLLAGIVGTIVIALFLPLIDIINTLG
mgnify:CR=1 FL=1